MSWMTLLEKLICLNRYLFLVTQSPRGTSSVLALSSSPCSRCDQAMESKPATSTSRSTCANATCCPSCTRLYQCCQDLSMPVMRQHQAETSNTQSVTTSTSYVQSRSGSRCVQDRSLSRDALLDLECCLHGNDVQSSMGCERVRDSWFSIITCMSRSLRAWLDGLGSLA